MMSQMEPAPPDGPLTAEQREMLQNYVQGILNDQDASTAAQLALERANVADLFMKSEGTIRNTDADDVVHFFRTIEPLYGPKLNPPHE